MKTQTFNPHPYRKPHLLAIMVLLLAAALVACGGGATETAPTAAVEAPPTAGEPTAEPAAEEPTEQPAEEPTAEPTDEPAPEPTEEAAEEEPVEDPATSGGVLTLTGDCGNAFYPVVEGRTYHYTTATEGLGESGYSISFSDVSNETFTAMTGLDGETIVSTVWTCTPEGLLSPEFSQIPGAFEGMTVEFVEAGGQSIGTEDKFRNLGTWEAHYVANVEMPDMGAGAMSIVETIDVRNEAVGVEAVSVPAGDYPEAVRVDSVVSIAVSFSVGGETAPGMGMDLSYSSWYVEGVGMVLSVVDDVMGMGGSRSELVSIEE